MLDAVLSMLNIRTAFGEPVKPGWPWPTKGNVVGAVASGPLIEALVVSCSRLLIGFAISVLVGVLLGVVIWTIKSVDQLLGPLFLGLQTLPSVCWVPLGILWFGINERGILFVLVMGSVFAIAISLRDGMQIGRAHV